MKKQTLTRDCQQVFHFHSGVKEVVECIARVSVKLRTALSFANIDRGSLSYSGKSNCQGEKVNAMDLYADKLLTDEIKLCGSVTCLISEEKVGPTYFNQDRLGQKYMVAVDPLDGSSNVDVNIPVGTIFAVYKTNKDQGKEWSGNQIVAAGYVMYGSSTQLVLSDGASTALFIYHPERKVYNLNKKEVMIPSLGQTYSINEGPSFSFDTQTLLFLQKYKEKPNITARYVGSLVADFHRNMIKGGVFLYPSTSLYPHGKLRLLYECLPLAFIIESCGGKAVSEQEKTMDLCAQEVHQRASLVIGSSNMVYDFLHFGKLAKLRTA